MHSSVRNKLITLFSIALALVVAFSFALDSKQQSTTVSKQKRAFPEFISSELVGDERDSRDTQELTLADITQHPYQLVNVWASW